ncbi:MAG: hypothetical protein RJA81_1212 [Planctomycetota bacterium]|jgi:hypothetical protein
MKKSDEILLNRHLDGDLNADEVEYVDFLLRSDPTIRQHFQDLNQTRLALASLPRLPIPEDMTSRVRKLMKSRRTVPIPVGTAETLGRFAVAAILVVVSGVTISVYRNQIQPRNAALNRHGSKILTVPANDLVETDQIADHSDHAENNQEPLTVASSHRSENSLPKPLTLPVATSAKPMESDSPTTELPTALKPLIAMQERLDRQHSLRVHVETANARVVDRIIQLLEKYRVPEIPMIRLKPQQRASKEPSIEMLGFVPTNLFDDLKNDLEMYFPGKVEQAVSAYQSLLDMPSDEYDWIDSREVAKAVKQVAGLASDEVTLSTPNHSKKETYGPNRRIIGNAIAEPLQPINRGSEHGTIDQVVIQIRSDPIPVGQ